MKRYIYVVSILFVIITSCSKDEAKLIIDDFSKIKKIEVKPYKGYPYSMMNIWVKGYVNDTILIRLNSRGSKPILKLKGEINERWYTDYYGEGPKVLFFDPYKATDGKLNIKFKL